MQQSQSIIAELEHSLNHGTSDQRTDVLRRVTDLFVNAAAGYSTDQVGLFDDVMGYLIRKIERVALIELSGRLAPVGNAPTKVVGQLARDDDIAVSGPILQESTVPTEADLLEIAKTKSQAHLLAIAGRASVDAAVTDVLVDRGDANVLHTVTVNQGARFSKLGLAKMVGKAEQDANLAAAIAARRDVPPQLFEELVLKATETVRQRILENADPEMREQVTQTLSTIARQVAHTEAPRASARRGPGVVMNDPRRLKANLAEFVQAGSAAEIIATFGALCGVPAKTVKDLVRQGGEEGMLILGKAGGLGWPEMKDVLSVTMPQKIQQSADQKALFEKFIALSPANAQRAVRFIKTSKGTSTPDIKRMM